MENRAYFLIDTKADLDVKWGRIVEGKPDFIKTFVLFTGTERQKGLDEEVLREIVKRAHAGGLRVSSHIETANDFRLAVEAGVDEINHLPMPRGKMPRETFIIDDATARRAAKRKVAVVTTVDVHERFGMTARPEHRAIFIENLQRLLRAGVRVAVGSDGISGELPMATALDEAMNLHRHGYATNLTLLKMWTEYTAATIFPRRKLGRLANGYEASFLVLDGDPVADFANVQKIALRVKQGRLL